MLEECEMQVSPLRRYAPSVEMTGLWGFASANAPVEMTGFVGVRMGECSGRDDRVVRVRMGECSGRDGKLRQLGVSA